VTILDDDGGDDISHSMGCPMMIPDPGVQGEGSFAYPATTVGGWRIALGTDQHESYRFTNRVLHGGLVLILFGFAKLEGESRVAVDPCLDGIAHFGFPEYEFGVRYQDPLIGAVDWMDGYG
jgi:hypothetical protein